MAFAAPLEQFQYGTERASSFAGKRVLISGAGRDGGIGQALAMAAALNGAAVDGVHFDSSYRDGLDLVNALRANGVKAFALQADVTNPRDMWGTRSYVIKQMVAKRRT